MPSNRVLASAAALAIFIGGAGVASAQEYIDATRPDVLRRIVSGWGEAKLETDDQGDPRISASIEGINYSMVFFGCSENKDCTNVTFYAGFSGTTMTAETMNEWNRTHRFGDGYLDETGDPWLKLPVNLHKGVTRENFIDTVDWWRVASTQFRDFVFK